MAPHRPRLLIDCDGVLAAFTQGALAIVAQVTDRQYAVEDVTGWDFCKALRLSPVETTRVKHKISTTAGFCAGLAPYPGAIVGVRRLRAIADVHVVTSPWNSNATWTFEREAWLHQHFGIPHDHVHHSSGKHLFAGDLFVDDKASHVDAWAEAWPRKVAVLWRTPHNRSDVAPRGSRVTASWEDLALWVREPWDTAGDLWPEVSRG